MMVGEMPRFRRFRGRNVEICCVFSMLVTLVTEMQIRNVQIGEAMNFDQSPMLVIWEVTQACDLACVHCRASAQPERNSGELTTEQGFRLLDEIRRFGEPLMIFTGGDPLKRPDLFELLRYSVKIGLRTNVTP